MQHQGRPKSLKFIKYKVRVPKKCEKTEIQTRRQRQSQIHTHRYGKIPNTQSRKDPNAKSQDD